MILLSLSPMERWSIDTIVGPDSYNVYLFLVNLTVQSQWSVFISIGILGKLSSGLSDQLLEFVSEGGSECRAYTLSGVRHWRTSLS